MSSSEVLDPRVMEAYKLAVEMADRTSARRGVANAFFLTVNTTLVTVVGLHRGMADSAVLWIAVCFAGVLVAVCWFFLLSNYRRLNEAKFAVINRIEDEHLPVKVFKDEWAILDGGRRPAGRLATVRAAFRQLSGVERAVPVVFGLLYVVLLVGRMLS